MLATTPSRSIAVGWLICAALLGLASHASAAPDEPGAGWHLARRFAGDVPQGELGFRFGEPLDVDGDGHADVAAGSRLKLDGVLQTGRAGVWSGATGRRIRSWDGEVPNGLFGHWVLPVADLGTDGLADVVIAAPVAVIDGMLRGVLVARSPKTGEKLWRHVGGKLENLGWDLAPAGDHDGDGVADIFVGTPGQHGGRVYVLGGKNGTVLRTYAPKKEEPSFGWYVARLDDLDGDGRAELAVGAPREPNADGLVTGAAYLVGSRTGTVLRRWQGTNAFEDFGEVVAAIGDLDGDRRGEVVVASSWSHEESRAHPGEVRVYSGASGKELRHWSGAQPGERYGRMVVGAGDVDGDGAEDLAIGAPGHGGAAGAQAGRVEIRSGRTGAVLAELFGDVADGWFGWHVRRAPDPEGRGRPALLISSIRHPVDGQERVGVIDLYVLRSSEKRPSGNEHLRSPAQ